MGIHLDVMSFAVSMGSATKRACSLFLASFNLAPLPLGKKKLRVLLFGEGQDVIGIRRVRNYMQSFSFGARAYWNLAVSFIVSQANRSKTFAVYYSTLALPLRSKHSFDDRSIAILLPTIVMHSAKPTAMHRFAAFVNRTRKTRMVAQRSGASTWIFAWWRSYSRVARKSPIVVVSVAPAAPFDRIGATIKWAWLPVLKVSSVMGSFHALSIPFADSKSTPNLSVGVSN